MKKYLFILSLLLLFSSLTGYEKKWTVMVFMNGDNDLDTFGDDDVLEMEKIGSGDQLDIIVLQDHFGKNNTERHYIRKGSKITEKIAETDMGDWREALKFFQWGVENHPSEHYLFIIWNHGSGWRKNHLFKGISTDAVSGNTIKTAHLKLLSQAMHQHIGRRVDILGYDACLMAMAEVAFETMKDVRYMVFSEQVEPGMGWPYDQFLKQLADTPDVTPEQLSRKLVKTYTSSYNGGSQGFSDSTLSAVDCARLEEIIPEFSGFVKCLLRKSDAFYDFIASSAAALEFQISDNKDLCDFLYALMKKTADSEIREGAGKILELLKGKNPVIIENSSSGISMARACGLSIFIPSRGFYSDESQKSYNQLQFSKETQWGDFITELCNPRCPVVSVRNIVTLDENSDGTVSPGEEVEFRITVKNESLIPGNRVRLNVFSDSLQVTVSENAAVTDVPADGSVMLSGFKARISDSCQANQTVQFTCRIIVEKQVTDHVFTLTVRRPFETENSVLLLVRNSANPCTDYFKEALASAGIKHDVWDVSYQGSADSGILKRYSMVFVSIPAADDTVAVDPGTLADYLEAGGSLFLSGQDIGEKFGKTVLFREYLRAEFIQDNTRIFRITGTDTMQGMEFSIAGGDGAGNQQWPDEIDILNPARSIFRYAAEVRGITSSGCAGLAVNTGLYQAVYLAFGLEGIDSQKNRAEVIKKSAELLTPDIEEKSAYLSGLEQTLLTAKSGEASVLRTRIEQMIEIIRDLAMKKIRNNEADLTCLDIESPAFRIIRSEIAQEVIEENMGSSPEN